MDNNKPIMKTCYMCENAQTSVEHAPPQSFFPKGKRENLITVPSCDAHNSDNSKDVEYVRAIIVSALGTRSIARTYFNDKVSRSWTRNDGSLGKRLLKDSFSMEVQNEEFPEKKETVGLPVEQERLDVIFRCMANALYYHDFGVKYNGREWQFLFADLNSITFLQTGVKTAKDEFRDEHLPKLEQLTFKQMETQNHDIFQYFVYAEAHNIIYKLLFYEGFRVYILS